MATDNHERDDRSERARVEAARRCGGLGGMFAAMVAIDPEAALATLRMLAGEDSEPSGKGGAS